jgi:hypothetical protein
MLGGRRYKKIGNPLFLTKTKTTVNSSGFGSEFGLTPGQTRRIGESETK